MNALVLSEQEAAISAADGHVHFRIAGYTTRTALARLIAFAATLPQPARVCSHCLRVTVSGVGLQRQRCDVCAAPRAAGGGGGAAGGGAPAGGLAAQVVQQGDDQAAVAAAVDEQRQRGDQQRINEGWIPPHEAAQLRWHWYGPTHVVCRPGSAAAGRYRRAGCP